MKIRALFMGTPEIAAIILKSLLTAINDETAGVIHDIEIAGVVTQPDKPKGRGHELSYSEVKTAAIEAGLSVFQPVKVRSEDFLKTFDEIKPDLVIVAAFGQILPEHILYTPKYGCINVHTSLLPKYRGAAPIQWAIIDGEKKTGVTIMYMDKGLDTGDIIMQKEVEISPDETGGSLYDKLAQVGSGLLIKALQAVISGKAMRTPQTGETNYAKMLTRELGHIDFSKSAAEIERLIRGLYPWPGTYAFIDGKLMKIMKASVSGSDYKTDDKIQAVPGTVCEVSDDFFSVMTGKGMLKIERLQIEGKKQMDARDFLRGFKLASGMRLS